MGYPEYILDGVRVLDLSTFVTGGFCSLMLANQGADVVKIEQPEVGDDIRHSGPPFVDREAQHASGSEGPKDPRAAGDRVERSSTSSRAQPDDSESPYFWTVNYDKRSVELNLKSEEGREALYDLAAESDVFIQNYRPGTAERLQVDYDRIAAENGDIIYCDISAFGQTGPWRKRPGYDLLVQGLSGIMDVTGETDGQPVKVGLPLTDLITAMWGAFGIVTSLYRREETGQGEYFDLGMLDATLPWLTKQAGKVFADETPQRMGTKDPVLAPYQTFRTADGHINVACLNQKLWQDFCVAIDREDLADDERFGTNADRVESMTELESEIERTLIERSTDEWLGLFVDAGIPAAPVQGVEEALYNEQTKERDVVGTVSGNEDDREIPVIEHPINFRRATSGFRSPPPRLGEHTRDIFEEIGYDEATIDHLFEQGAIGSNTVAPSE